MWEPRYNHLDCGRHPKAADEHVLAGLLPGRPARALYRCVVCGRRRAGAVVHAEGAPGFTACQQPERGRVLERSLDLRRTLGGVNCPDCLELLPEPQVELPLPDWRPLLPIAEDYYAG